MNTNSPFVPQGTTPPRPKSSLLFKIMLILAIHVVIIGGMLMQGCRDIPKERASDMSATNSPETVLAGAPSSNSNSLTIPPVSLAALSNNAVAASQPIVTPAPPVLLPSPLPTVTNTPPVVASHSDEYVITAGDTLSAVAKKHHVALSALLAANPGVDAKKLHPGQKVIMPTSTLEAETAASVAPTKESATAETSFYIVKTGDTLGKIAKQHGLSFKKLMALNALKTTSIHVGQKLKLPAATSTASAAAQPQSLTVAQPQAASTPGPVYSTTTSSASPATGGN